ncbi:MAG: hypothetical protein ACFFAY_04610 [Promethearchaeota archaeon]
MGFIKDDWLLPLGALCLAVAIGMDRFLVRYEIIDFAIGVLIGLSMVLNLIGLHRSRNRVS